MHPLHFKYPNAPNVGGWVEMAMRMALVVDGGDEVGGGCGLVVSRSVEVAWCEAAMVTAVVAVAGDGGNVVVLVLVDDDDNGVEMMTVFVVGRPKSGQIWEDAPEKKKEEERCISVHLVYGGLHYLLDKVVQAGTAPGPNNSNLKDNNYNKW
nr:hypothetical protein [Tanacetum cinerariifolium]